jgi:hypothetical protein
MKTAVEYIKEKLMCDEYWYENMTFDQIFEKAKEMEKEQIEKAIDDYFIQHIRRTTTMHEVIIKDVSLLDNMIENGDIICFDDSKHEKKYDDLKERNGRFG